jgi:hypothetical protein
MLPLNTLTARARSRLISPSRLSLYQLRLAWRVV